MPLPLSFSCPKRKRKGPAVPMRRPPARVFNPGPVCGHPSGTAYSGPGGPEQGMDLNGASERPSLCKGTSRAPITFPKPPLCKGRCRAAAEGLETLPDFPLPGNHSKIPTPQAAFRPPAPLAQGSLQQRLSGERNIEHIFLSIHVPRGTSPTSQNTKIKKNQSKCSPWNILGPKTPPKPPKMPKLPPKSFYCIASVV